MSWNSVEIATTKKGEKNVISLFRNCWQSWWNPATYLCDLSTVGLRDARVDFVSRRGFHTSAGHRLLCVLLLCSAVVLTARGVHCTAMSSWKCYIIACISVKKVCIICYVVWWLLMVHFHFWWSREFGAQTKLAIRPKKRITKSVAQSLNFWKISIWKLEGKKTHKAKKISFLLWVHHSVFRTFSLGSDLSGQRLHHIQTILQHGIPADCRLARVFHTLFLVTSVIVVFITADSKNTTNWWIKSQKKGVTYFMF